MLFLSQTNRWQKIKRTLTQHQGSFYSGLVPKAGLEPARGRPHWILSPARLPFHHFGLLLIYNIILILKNQHFLSKKNNFLFLLLKCVFRLNFRQNYISFSN